MTWGSAWIFDFQHCQGSAAWKVQPCVFSEPAGHLKYFVGTFCDIERKEEKKTKVAQGLTQAPDQVKQVAAAQTKKRLEDALPHAQRFVGKVHNSIPASDCEHFIPLSVLGFTLTQNTTKEENLYRWPELWLRGRWYQHWGWILVGALSKPGGRGGLYCSSQTAGVRIIIEHGTGKESREPNNKHR